MPFVCRHVHCERVHADASVSPHYFSTTLLFPTKKGPVYTRMKKETVYDFLNTLERQTKTRNESGPDTLEAALQAIEQCRFWVALSWTTMLVPVRAARQAVSAEGHPLLEKWKKKTCTEQETLHMYALVAQDEVYDRFEKKIRPSVERAVRVRDAQLAQRRLAPTTLPA